MKQVLDLIAQLRDFSCALKGLYLEQERYATSKKSLWTLFLFNPHCNNKNIKEYCGGGKK
jgi:hypothetical protein